MRVNFQDNFYRIGSRFVVFPSPSPTHNFRFVRQSPILVSSSLLIPSTLSSVHPKLHIQKSCFTENQLWCTSTRDLLKDISIRDREDQHPEPTTSRSKCVPSTAKQQPPLPQFPIRNSELQKFVTVLHQRWDCFQ